MAKEFLKNLKKQILYSGPHRQTHTHTHTHTDTLGKIHLNSNLKRSGKALKINIKTLFFICFDTFFNMILIH